MRLMQNFQAGTEHLVLFGFCARKGPFVLCFVKKKTNRPYTGGF